MNDLSLFLPLRWLCVAILLPFGCTRPEIYETLSGNWEFAYYETLETGFQSHPPDHLPFAVTADFEDNGRKGQFDIATITNRILGTYKLDEAGSLAIKEIKGTQVGEPEWVVPLWESLASADAYQRSGSTMKIFYQEGKKALVFHEL